MDKSDLQTFDPTQPWSISAGRLPHWHQPGTVCFITSRTNDSLPPAALRRWGAERDKLLRQVGLQPGSDWQTQLAAIPDALRFKLQWTLTDCFDRYLDNGYGPCVLRQAPLQKIIQDSLVKFDGDHYLVTDFVIMPNHVHLLAAFREEGDMTKQCANWKRYTAREINTALKRSGEFWQIEAFDHLVRSLDYFDAYRRYIANNGPQAKLPKSDYLHFSKPLS